MTANTSPAKMNKFQTLMWRYMRWSGFLLIPLAFGHLAIMHIINSVYDINYVWVIERRWAMLGWRIYDAALLWFAGIHGFNGLRIIINDYVHKPSLNMVLKIVSIGVLVIVFLLGTIALIGAPLRPIDLNETLNPLMFWV